MNRETPLAHVALFLPKEAALLLEFQPIHRQNAILTRIRGVLVDWEEKGITIEDPIVFAEVLTSFVKELLALYMGLLNHLQAHSIDPASWEGS